MNGGWVLDVDIRKYFDSIPHSQLKEILRHRVKDQVVLRLLFKWLRAGVWENGTLTVNDEGTPQGGVISPVLANLFMHYAFDRWISKKYPKNPWARYADDGVVHCKSKKDAEEILENLKGRLLECGLEMHPQKTKMVYCRSDKFNGRYENESF